jgi:DNA-binding CsgD family transcriptional regulator
VADLGSAVDTYRTLGLGPQIGACRSDLALALPPTQGRVAIELVEEELSLAEAVGIARHCGVALRARGLLRSGRSGLADLEDSVRRLETTGARLELARSLTAYGAMLRRQGRRIDAREPLGRARDLALQCGADRLVAKAGEELRASGARPRRVALTGPAALTASELRIAQLAAAGRSNTEIAQTLFVSRKTVETHLTHVYAKLGLAGQPRGDLAAALARSPAQ